MSLATSQKSLCLDCLGFDRWRRWFDLSFFLCGGLQNKRLGGRAVSRRAGVAHAVLFSAQPLLSGAQSRGCFVGQTLHSGRHGQPHCGHFPIPCGLEVSRAPSSRRPWSFDPHLFWRTWRRTWCLGFLHNVAMLQLGLLGSSSLSLDPGSSVAKTAWSQLAQLEEGKFR